LTDLYKNFGTEFIYRADVEGVYLEYLAISGLGVGWKSDIGDSLRSSARAIIIDCVGP